MGCSSSSARRAAVWASGGAVSEERGAESDRLSTTSALDRTRNGTEVLNAD